MAYSKALANKYAKNRNKYRSSDHALAPFLKKAGIKNRVILDFGCGDGPETERFIKLKAKKVVGVDPSGEMIKLAKMRKIPNAIFIKTNGETLPLKNNEFNLVYSRFVLHYIKNLNSQFREIYRALKPTGYFIAIFQCLTDNPNFVNKRVPINLGKGKDITKIEILSKSASEIQTILTEVGFKVLKFVKVKNTDSHIDSSYKDKNLFKNTTHALLVQKLSNKM